MMLLGAAGLAVASASNVYIAQSAVGSTDGSSCGNARAVSFFNTAGNWGVGSTQIGPGTTVHLCGTVTTELTAQGSGSSGAPLTIRFEPNAKISLPACDNTNGCLNIDNKSWIVIDGGTPCGPGTSCATAEEDGNSGNTGIIESTLNGTPGGPCTGGKCTKQVSSRGISAVTATNIEIKNLIVRNMYVHVACLGTDSSSNCVPDLNSDSGILSFQATDSVKFAVHDTTVHDGRELITYAPGNNDHGPQFYNVNLYHTAGAIKIAGSNSSNQLQSLTVHDSHIHDLSNWDAYDCVNAYHLDGIHMWGLSGGINRNISFYNNLVDGNFGSCQTGTVFFEGENENVLIYNNIVSTTYTQNNNGVVNVNGTGFQIYNNTIAGADSGGDLCFNVGRPSGRPTITFQNNIVTGCNTLVQTQNSPVMQAWDYNVYGGCSTTGCNWGTPFVVNGGTFDAFAQWKTATSADAHSQYGSSTTFALLNPDGSLQSNSPAIGIGANLTALAITALNSDTSRGNMRTPTPRVSGACVTPGSAGCWAVGAFNYAGASQGPQPPTNLSASAQ